jgi:hypothetical protein
LPIPRPAACCRHVSDAGRIVIGVRSGPIVFFDHDCAVPVHLRDVSHMTRRPGEESIRLVGAMALTDGVWSTRKPMLLALAAQLSAFLNQPTVPLGPLHAISEVDTELVDPSCYERSALPGVETPPIAPGASGVLFL